MTPEHFARLSKELQDTQDEDGEVFLLHRERLMETDFLGEFNFESIFKEFIGGPLRWTWSVTQAFRRVVLGADPQESPRSRDKSEKDVGK